MVTRKDVAEIAGVSVTAVSRVVNNSGYVAKEKREAVLKAVKKLGYRASPVAVAMQKKATRQILFFNKDLSNAYNIDLYRGMIQYATKFGYMIVLSGTWDIERIKTMLIDGVILPSEVTTEKYVKAIQNAMKIPTVSASYGSCVMRPKHIPFIEADTYIAMETMLDYIMEKGHKKIALASPYINAENNPRCAAYKTIMYPILKNKLDEYMFFCEDTPDSNDFIEEDFFKYGEKLAQAIYESGIDATAVVCFNDDTAIGVIHELQRLGVRIPEDISVAGIDGLNIGNYIYPKLTTVSLNPVMQGEKCAEILIKMLKGKKVNNLTQIPSNIIEGESVSAI